MDYGAGMKINRDREDEWVQNVNDNPIDETVVWVDTWKHREIFPRTDRYQGWMDDYEYPYRSGKGWETACKTCGLTFWNVMRGRLMDDVERHVLRNCQPPVTYPTPDYDSDPPY